MRKFLMALMPMAALALAAAPEADAAAATALAPTMKSGDQGQVEQVHWRRRGGLGGLYFGFGWPGYYGYYPGNYYYDDYYYRPRYYYGPRFYSRSWRHHRHHRPFRYRR
jgi:hypothetical protein